VKLSGYSDCAAVLDAAGHTKPSDDGIQAVETVPDLDVLACLQAQPFLSCAEQASLIICNRIDIV